MEYIQDYIMRMIHEMVRFYLKLFFGIDSDEALQKQLEESARHAITYSRLMALVEKGRIDQAENLLYEESEHADNADLLVGLAFYDQLNRLTDEDLETHNFNRQEVRDGLTHYLQKYGYSDLPL